MKICMFTNTYRPHVGGVANSVATFAEDLRRIGHRVLIVAPEFDNEPPEEAGGDEVVRLPAIQNFNGSDFAVRMPIPFLVADRMEAFQPDLVHSHHPYLLGDSALRTAKHHRIPLVFTHHTLYERYTHYVSSDSAALRRFAVHLSTEYANLCTRVVAPSASIARLLSDRGVQKPVDVIPTGVDLPFFAAGDREGFRQAHGIPKDAIVVGHVGRLAPEKNLVYLAQAVAAFLQTEEKACFLVIGSGPSESDIAAIIAREGLTARLAMAGRQSGKALRDGYRAMDVFGFASQSETQGMVLTEALAAGVPVVALDGSGVREVVQDGVNGRLLPADTPVQDFARALRGWLSAHPPATGDPSRIRSSVAGFDRRACARRMADLYASALEDQRHQEGPETDADPLDSLVQRIRTEWDLVESKLSAAIQTFSESETPE
jgi:1,2-diacylglycerol 3-alpha-glucosyltransferase